MRATSLDIYVLFVYFYIKENVNVVLRLMWNLYKVIFMFNIVIFTATDGQKHKDIYYFVSVLAVNLIMELKFFMKCHIFIRESNLDPTHHRGNAPRVKNCYCSIIKTIFLLFYKLVVLNNNWIISVSTGIRNKTRENSSRLIFRCSLGSVYAWFHRVIPDWIKSSELSFISIFSWWILQY